MITLAQHSNLLFARPVYAFGVMRPIHPVEILAFVAACKLHLQIHSFIRQRHNNVRLMRIGLHEIITPEKYGRSILKIRRIRANLWHRKQERRILHQQGNIPVVRMVVVGAVGQYNVRRKRAYVADKVFARFKRNLKLSVRIVQHVVTAAKQSSARSSLAAALKLKFFPCYLGMVGTRASIRNGKQTHLPALVTQLGKQTAAIGIRIVRMGAYAQYALLFFHMITPFYLSMQNRKLS